MTDEHQQISIVNSKPIVFKSTQVDKLIEPKVDIGNLLIEDLDPIDDNR
jgi:hypothetical protein